jgi:hypothetical protein
LYIALQAAREIKRFNIDSGQFVELLVPAGLEASELIAVSGFAFDSQGRLYISAGTPMEQRGSRVLRYAPTRPQD